MRRIFFGLKVKTTNQTKFSLFFSDGRRLTYGNCLVACVASYLEEPIDEVPNIYTFYGLGRNKEESPLWLEILNLWMERKHNKKMLIKGKETTPKEEYVIVRGKSARGRSHCCIYRKEGEDLVPFFDPHPTSQFLKEIDLYYLIENI